MLWWEKGARLRLFWAVQRHSMLPAHAATSWPLFAFSHNSHPCHLTCLPPQWVFYIFGASAVLWLPFWLPQSVEGGTASRGGGSGSGGDGSGGGAKPFTIRGLFGTADIEEEARVALTASPEQRGAASAARSGGGDVAAAADGRRLRPQRSLPDDAGGALAAGLMGSHGAHLGSSSSYLVVFKPSI